MEEKERYEYYLGTNSIKDNKTNQIYGYIVDLLNQQDKRIKELEEELDDAKRDYIPKLEFGLQRANKMGRDAEEENRQLREDLQAKDILVNTYMSVVGTLDNAKQLKEAQKQLAVEELEKLKDFFLEPYRDEEMDTDFLITKDAGSIADYVLDRIKELKGEE